MEILNQKVSEKQAWMVIGSASALLAGVAARNALQAAWRYYYDEDPPLNPASHDTAWPEALAWTAMTGMTVAVARLFAKRGAAAGWKSYMGSLPDRVEGTS